GRGRLLRFGRPRGRPSACRRRRRPGPRTAGRDRRGHVRPRRDRLGSGRPRRVSFEPARARELEERDPLRSLRDEFLVPDGWAYLAGNSLGLQPRAAQAAIQDELDEWARLGVEGWFEAREPWLEYAGSLRNSVARLVGAAADEGAVMNTLTVNLHLLLVTFYRPTAERFRILIEDTAFPSDSYAVQSQVAWHGLDPAEAVVRAPIGEVEETIQRVGDALAVVLLPG